MSTTDNGGPAFPCNEDRFPDGVVKSERCEGMTLRDYFAAKAMQAYNSDPDWRRDMDPTDTAYAAYKQADAMLKASTA